MLIVIVIARSRVIVIVINQFQKLQLPITGCNDDNSSVYCDVAVGNLLEKRIVLKWPMKMSNDGDVCWQSVPDMSS